MTMRRRGQTEQGVTLLELVATAVPAAILGLVLLAVLGFGLGFIERGGRETSAVQEARIALHFLAMEIREASDDPRAIAVWRREQGAPQDAVGFLSARAESPGRVFAADADGSPRWLGAVFYIHDPSSGELRRIERPLGNLTVLPSTGEGRVVARRVKELEANLQRGLVTARLTIEGARADVVLHVAARPRN
jgi:hypothetical protein